MTRVWIVGLDQLPEFSRRLRRAADKDLRVETLQALNRSSKPAREAVLSRLESYLPDRYAATLRRQLRMRTQLRGGRNSSVTIRGKAKGPTGERYVDVLDRGVLRHMAWGNRGRWYVQQVTPGFFTEPMQDNAPVVRHELERALGIVARKL